MPADLVPNESIPELAARVDSPAMLSVLQYMRKKGFILNGRDVDPRMTAVLQRLADLGLVDPGYEGQTNGKPYLWTSNANGLRVLEHFENSPRLMEAVESKLKLHPRASTALASLSDEWDRSRVLAAAETLQSHDPAAWPEEEVTRLAEDQRLYLLRIGPDLRAFVEVLDSGEIEVSDVVRAETLRLFLEGKKSAGALQ